MAVSRPVARPPAPVLGRPAVHRARHSLVRPVGRGRRRRLGPVLPRPAGAHVRSHPRHRTFAGNNGRGHLDAVRAGVCLWPGGIGPPARPNLRRSARTGHSRVGKRCTALGGAVDGLHRGAVLRGGRLGAGGPARWSLDQGRACCASPRDSYDRRRPRWWWRFSRRPWLPSVNVGRAGGPGSVWRWHRWDWLGISAGWSVTRAIPMVGSGPNDWGGTPSSTTARQRGSSSNR
jgi:hypothetical protein